MATTFADDVVFQGNLTVVGTPPSPTRAQLTQATERWKIQLADFRIHDAFASLLPATSSSNDLGLVGGAFATNSPSLQSADLKAAGSTSNYARVSFNLPCAYVAGQTCQVRVWCKMKTTVADTAATIDVECYRSGDGADIGSDLCVTSAQSMNSLTLAAKDFTITPATLNPGDTLDIRLTALTNDAAGITAVISMIGGVEMLLGTKG